MHHTDLQAQRIGLQAVVKPLKSVDKISSNLQCSTVHSSQPGRQRGSANAMFNSKKLNKAGVKKAFENGGSGEKIAECL